MNKENVYFRARGEPATNPARPEPLNRRKKEVEGATYKVINGELVMISKPPVTEPPKLRAGFFKSVDGRKCHIIYLNKNSKAFPVVGMIQTDGVWAPMVWNLEGVAKKPYGQVNDIVDKWSEG